MALNGGMPCWLHTAPWQHIVQLSFGKCLTALATSSGRILDTYSPTALPDNLQNIHGMLDVRGSAFIIIVQ